MHERIGRLDAYEGKCSIDDNRQGQVVTGPYTYSAHQKLHTKYYKVTYTNSSKPTNDYEGPYIEKAKLGAKPREIETPCLGTRNLPVTSPG